MKRLLILCSILLLMSSSAMAASKYVKIEPEFLQPYQSKSSDQVNETLAIIFSKIKEKGFVISKKTF